MASREEYTTCMKPYMSGSGKNREERQAGMCIGAKLCTGKASDLEGAKKLCTEAMSQPRKANTVRTRRGGKLDVATISACIIPKITDCSSLTQSTLANLISECASVAGTRVKKPETKNHAINKCIEERAVSGTFAESVSLRKKCLIDWNIKQTSQIQVGNV